MLDGFNIKGYVSGYYNSDFSSVKPMNFIVCDGIIECAYTLYNYDTKRNDIIFNIPQYEPNVNQNIVNILTYIITFLSVYSICSVLFKNMYKNEKYIKVLTHISVILSYCLLYVECFILGSYCWGVRFSSINIIVIFVYLYDLVLFFRGYNKNGFQGKRKNSGEFMVNNYGECGV